LLAFQSYNTWYEKDIPKKIKKLESRYAKYLEELKDKTHNSYVIEGFPVSHTLFKGNEDLHVAERIHENRHLFLGILIIFQK